MAGKTLEAYSLYERINYFFPAGIVADRQMLDAHLGDRERNFLDRLADLLAESHVTFAENSSTRLMEFNFQEIGYFEARTVTLPWWNNRLDGYKLKETLEADFDTQSEDPFSYKTMVMQNKRLLAPQLGERERDFLLRIAALLESEPVVITENPRTRLIEISFCDHSYYVESLVTLPDWPKKLDPWKLKAVLHLPSPADHAPSLSGDLQREVPSLPRTPDELRTYYWGFGYGYQGKLIGEVEQPSFDQLVKLLFGSSAPWGPLHREAFARLGSRLLAAGVTAQLNWEPALIIELAGASGLATSEVRKLLFEDDQETYGRVIDRIYKDALKFHERGEEFKHERPATPDGLEPTLGDQHS